MVCTDMSLVYWMLETTCCSWFLKFSRPFSLIMTAAFGEGGSGAARAGQRSTGPKKGALQLCSIVIASP